VKYTTYIFDFDYTLVDATMGIVDSFNYAFKQLGLEPGSRDRIRKTVGMPLRDAFYELSGSSDKLLAEHFVSHFKDKADKVMTASTVLFNDTIPVLSQIKERSCNIAIVTNKNHSRINEAMDKFNMHELIDYIVGIEDVEAPKPSPEGLIKTIEHFGIPKQYTLFVGDTIMDASTAANAQIDFAAVLTGTTPAQAFKSLPHIFIAKNLTELIKHVALKN